MKYVYEFEHVRTVAIDKDTGDVIHNTKLLGFFSTKEKCKELIPFYLEQPGFKDFPNDFSIKKIEADINDFNETGGEFGTTVFQLTHEWYDGEYDYVSHLGVYSTKKLAKKSLASYKLEPEFLGHPDGFCIDECLIDECEWKEGFFTY